ncbi:MAG: aspartyl protease [Prevotella sp.]|nr:aspartyl protease [Prevotella sp.]
MRRKIISILTLLWGYGMAAMAQMHSYNTNFEYSMRNFVDTIPIEIENDQIFVWVEMNGERHRFNIDTGSSQGAVYQGAHLGSWSELGSVVSRDAAGHRDTVHVIQLPTFRLGQLEVSKYVASVFPRQRARLKYDAILGFDLFNKGLCCKIDARQGYMVITDRRDFFDMEPGYGIRYKLKWFVPYLLVSPFKRHVDEVLFDTGSRQLYTMNKQSFDAHAYKSKNVDSQIEGRAEGAFAIGNLGAEQTDEVVFMKLDRLKWDEFSFNNVRAITTQGASRIGARILDYGTVTINGFRRKITFQPYDGADSVEVNNAHPHIAYVPRNGMPTIGLIVEGCVEYRAGLRQGDTILAIDGQPISSFNDFLDYPFVEGRTYKMLVRDKEGRNKSVVYCVSPTPSSLDKDNDNPNE